MPLRRKLPNQNLLQTQLLRENRRKAPTKVQQPTKRAGLPNRTLLKVQKEQENPQQQIL